MLTKIDDNKTVAELVLEYPVLVKIFEDHDIDYCCGGKKQLKEAVSNSDISLNEITKLLEEQLAKNDFEHKDPQFTDSFQSIIEHLVLEYHEPTKALLEQVIQQSQKVAKVHGHKDERLIKLSEKILEIANELMPHMEKEEKVLFPYLLQLDQAESIPEMHCGTVRNPIMVMEREHDLAGHLLAQAKDLANNFIAAEGACNTHQVLLKNLKTLVKETHKHIHIENNILFPKTIDWLVRHN